MAVEFACQMCRAKLTLTGGVDGVVDQRHGLLNVSVFDGAKIDESFVVLNDSRPPGGAWGARRAS